MLLIARKVFSNGHRLEVERTPISDSGVLLDDNHDEFQVDPFMHSSSPDMCEYITRANIQVDSDGSDLADSLSGPKSSSKSTSNAINCGVWDIEKIDCRVDSKAGIAHSWNLVVTEPGGESDLSSEVSECLLYIVVRDMIQELKAIARLQKQCVVGMKELGKVSTYISISSQWLSSKALVDLTENERRISGVTSSCFGIGGQCQHLWILNKITLPNFVL